MKNSSIIPTLLGATFLSSLPASAAEPKAPLQPEADTIAAIQKCMGVRPNKTKFAEFRTPEKRYEVNVDRKRMYVTVSAPLPLAFPDPDTWNMTDKELKTHTPEAQKIYAAIRAGRPVAFFADLKNDGKIDIADRYPWKEKGKSDRSVICYPDDLDKDGKSVCEATLSPEEAQAMYREVLNRVRQACEAKKEK